MEYRVVVVKVVQVTEWMDNKELATSMAAILGSVGFPIVAKVEARETEEELQQALEVHDV